jgi:phage shock protein PspC (stress-responsive transcriptional regulator)
MDESTNLLTPPPPPPASTPPRRRLVRRTDQKVLGGVCAGLGEYFDVDPVLFRVGFVVLALAGGVGLLAYGLAWLLIPASDGTEPIAGRVGRHIGPGLSGGAWVGIALLVIGGSLLLTGFGHHGVLTWAFRPGLVWGAALILLGLLLYQRRERARAGGELPQPPAPAGSSEAGAATPTGAETAPFGPAAPTGPETAPFGPAAPTGPETARFGPAPATVPAASPWADTRTPDLPVGYPVARTVVRRERSALGWITLGVLLLVVGAIALLDAVGVMDLTVGRYLALSLTVMGVGLMVGAWFGRARWLILVGILLVPFVLAASLIDVPLTGGVGTRSYAPVASTDVRSEYRLAAGQLDLNLMNAALGAGTRTVTASVALGQLTVEVPTDVLLTIRAAVGAGSIRVRSDVPSAADRSIGGVKLQLDESAGPSTASSALVLNVESGYGEVDVNRLQRPELG